MPRARSLVVALLVAHRMRRWLPFATLAVAVTSLPVASCGGPTTNPQTASAAGSAPPSSSVVGPQGGTVSLSDGTSVSVPVGALTNTQTITITPSAASNGSKGVTSVGSAYEFGPDGLKFSHPVTVTLAFDPKRLPAGKSAADVKVFMAPGGTTSFTALPTIAVDATHVAAPTMHFTTGIPGTPEGPLGPPDPLPPSTTLPPPKLLTPKDGHGDVVCFKQGADPKWWYTTAQCMPRCLGSAIAPANCFVKPTCPGILKKISSADNNTFSSLYQQAAGTMNLAPSSLMFGVMPQGAGFPQGGNFQAGEAAYILKTFFNHGPPEIRIEVAWGSPNPDDWAHLGVAPGKEDSTNAQANYMVVQGLGFKEQSPGAEVSTLGHEMIHYTQHQRVNHVYMARISNIANAIRELEAYAWETGQIPVDVAKGTAVLSSFAWPDHHDESTLKCGDNYEREAAVMSAGCYEWKVEHLISLIVKHQDQAALEDLTNWLGPKQGDPWASGVWVQLHPDWGKLTDPPSPEYTFPKDDGLALHSVCKNDYCENASCDTP